MSKATPPSDDGTVTGAAEASESSEADDGKRYGEHVRDQTASSDREYWRGVVRDTVAEAHRKVTRGDAAAAGELLRDYLLPALDELDYVAPIPTYHAELHHSDLPWHWGDLRTFLNDPDAVIGAARAPTPRSEATALSLSSRSWDRPAPEIIQRALVSLESVSTHHEITPKQLKNLVDATGYVTKLGENLQDWDFDIGDPVKITTEQISQIKTLFCGPPGFGKSVGLEREAEDYFCRSLVDGYSDVKLIDPLGFRDGENWFYDIPQQDDELRRLREEDFDLPASFLDGDVATDREIQILLPLTPGLSEEELPYNTETGTFVTQPFTIPAADIPKAFLIAICSARLTPEQEGIVRDAYDEVNHRRDDWTLADLAEEIRTRDELSDSKKKPVTRTLKQLQNKGFIRTRDDDRTLDWTSIYNSTDVVTVISQAYMNDDIGRLIVFGYLAHELFVERSKMDRVPETAVLCREFWKVAPHNRRQSFDTRAANLQGAIGQMLTEVMRENRHSGLHVLADTQEPSDLMKSIRELFDRYVVYGANQRTVKNITEWTGNDKWRAFYNTISAEIGQASITGQVQPAVDERGIEFVGPVNYAPPSHHHRNADYDFTGAYSRAKYTKELDELDTEVLRRPADVDGVEWQDEVPPMLRVDAGYDAETGEPDVMTNPVPAFANKCITEADEMSVKRDDVKAAFNAFAAEQTGRTWDFTDRGIQSKFGQRFSDVFDDEDLPGRTTKDHDAAYSGIMLTRPGQEFLDRALEEAGSMQDALVGDVPVEEPDDEADAVEATS